MLQIFNRMKNYINRRIPKTYGFTIRSFELEKEGSINFAKWDHPFEGNKVITQQMIDHLRTFVQEGDTLLDIGAHSGDTSIPMALATGPGGKVLAFEPNPHVFKILAHNCKLNPGRTNIIPFNFALDEKDGTLVFNYSDASFCNGGALDRISEKKNHKHPYALSVNAVEPMAFLKKALGPEISKISFIKIDTEGQDERILQLLSPIIEKNRPVIMAEVFLLLNREQRLSFLNFFKSLDYELFHIDEHFVRNGTKVQDEDFLELQHFDLLAFPQEKSAVNLV